MKAPRIVFMGTPDFAVSILKGLVENNYNIVAVITAPDKPSGRGRKLNSPAVKTYAQSKDLKILQPTNLKSEEFLNELRELNADLNIVVAFRMLPKQVWSMPKMGTFNLHASLLPQYRGAAPINWAIINGEKKSGVTTFLLNENIDEGSILLQRELEIEPKDNAGSLHDKLMYLGVDLVLETVDALINDNIQAKAQDKTIEYKAAPKIFKESCKIDLSKEVENIFNHIRGMSPYPGAWLLLNNGSNSVECKIFDCEIEKIEHNIEIGKLIIDNKKLRIAVIGGFLQINELQISGKKRLKIGDLLNGYKFDENSFVA